MTVAADELRRAWWVRLRRAPVEPQMIMTERGIVLGAGTLLRKRAAGGEDVVDQGTDEGALALLAVAYGRAVMPAVLANMCSAARSWAAGDTCLAQVHLARIGLPALAVGDAAPFRLFAADRLLRDGISPRRLLELLDLDVGGLDALEAGYDPDEPRVPEGDPDGGEWTDGQASENRPAPAGARPRPGNNAPADKDPFFDTLYGPIHATAPRLGIDETWLLGLAAHEGGWLKPHNRAINNPFGVTHAGGRDVQYNSMSDAVAAWARRYGPTVQGATSAQDFVQRLLAAGYNKRDPQWSGKVLTAISSVERRIDSWKSRHGA